MALQENGLLKTVPERKKAHQKPIEKRVMRKLVPAISQSPSLSLSHRAMGLSCKGMADRRVVAA
jgi:hypothetical protein